MYTGGLRKFTSQTICAIPVKGKVYSSSERGSKALILSRLSPVVLHIKLMLSLHVLKYTVENLVFHLPPDLVF